MAQIDLQIGLEIEQLAVKAMGGKLRFPIMTGTVIAGSYDDNDNTVSVLLSVDDTDAPTQGILTNVVVQNADGLTVVPADGSEVWVAELDGPGKLGIIKTSAIIKMNCSIGSNSIYIDGNQAIITQGEGVFTMNNNQFQLKNSGGSLKTYLDNLLSHIQALTVPTGVGPSGIPINLPDFVTDKANFDSLLF